MAPAWLEAWSWLDSNPCPRLSVGGGARRLSTQSSGTPAACPLGNGAKGHTDPKSVEDSQMANSEDKRIVVPATAREVLEAIRLLRLADHLRNKR